MARKKKLSENDQKQLLILKSTYEMHLRSREDTLLRGKKDSIERMDLIIKDDLEQISKIDPDFAKQCAEQLSKRDVNQDLMKVINDDNSGTLFDELEKLDVVEEKYEKINEPTPKVGEDDFYNTIDNPETDIYDIANEVPDSFKQLVELQEEEIQDMETGDIYNDVDESAQYDIIPLPSKGECYKNKLDKIPVGYLTASDENLITSPNLYESGSISNVLLKRKVLNKSVDIDNLTAGDVDAIMVFLRGTSYGNDFPITATDPTTGKKIESVVDLSKLKYKPFTLKGDENGCFDFTLPRTKMKLKFKFLTKKQEKLLQKLNKKEYEGIASFELSEAVEKVKNALKNDSKLNDTERNIIIDANNKLEKWSKSLNEKQAVPYTKAVTNSMEMQIVSINGNADRKFIHDTIMNMPASDSLAYRRYIYDNQPGVDFEIEVKRPESMGGGSFKTFLEWDDTIFFNISNVQ